MHLAIDWPSPTTPAPQLCVLLHDDGTGGTSMFELAQQLRRTFSDAAIAAPEAWHAVGDDARCWLDPAQPAGEDAAPGPEAWAAAVARLHTLVMQLQQRAVATPQATLVAGCGRGADLALALAQAHDGLAGRVLSFGGRYVDWPHAAPQATTLHLLYAGADAALPEALARRTLQHLGVLHADATLDLAAEVGDPLHPALIECALHRLKAHIPMRTWREALGAARRQDTNDPEH